MMRSKTAISMCIGFVAGIAFLVGCGSDTASNAIAAAENFWSKNGTSIHYPDGNVGIGTTTPQAKLDVAGDINFTGQKVCHAIISGNWRNTLLVPTSWSAPTCADYMTATGTNAYVLGCTFKDSFSMGTVNGGIPSPNCGW